MGAAENRMAGAEEDRMAGAAEDRKQNEEFGKGNHCSCKDIGGRCD